MAKMTREQKIEHFVAFAGAQSPYLSEEQVIQAYRDAGFSIDNTLAHSLIGAEVTVPLPKPLGAKAVKSQKEFKEYLSTTHPETSVKKAVKEYRKSGGHISEHTAYEIPREEREIPTYQTRVEWIVETPYPKGGGVKKESGFDDFPNFEYPFDMKEPYQRKNWFYIELFDTYKSDASNIRAVFYIMAKRPHAILRTAVESYEWEWSKDEGWIDRDRRGM